MIGSLHSQATAPRSWRVLERFFEGCTRVVPPPATSFPGHPVNPVICIKAAKRRASRAWRLPRGRVGKWYHETTIYCRRGSWLEYARERSLPGIWNMTHAWIEQAREEVRKEGPRNRFLSWFLFGVGSGLLIPGLGTASIVAIITGAVGGAIINSAVSGIEIIWNIIENGNIE